MLGRKLGLGKEVVKAIFQEDAEDKKIIIEFCPKNEDGSPRMGEEKRGYIEQVECRLDDSWQHVYVRVMEE